MNNIYEQRVKDLFTFNLGEEVWAILPNNEILKGNVECYVMNRTGIKMLVHFEGGVTNHYWLGNTFTKEHIFKKRHDAEKMLTKLILRGVC